MPSAIAVRLLAGSPLALAHGLGRSFHAQAVRPPSAPAARPTTGVSGPIHTENDDTPIRVACVGDSITQGAGTSNEVLFSYPAQLKRMLDENWDVQNFGVSGTTLLSGGDLPYQRQDAFKAALAFQPNVVVIMLGTNDSKPQNWKLKDHFTADYLDLIAKFRALSMQPRMFLCLPIPSFGAGNYGINEAAIDEELPLIRSIALSQHLDLIDMQTPFTGMDALLPDRVHPSNDGAALMARTVYKALTGKDYVGPSVLSLKSLLSRALGFV